MRQAPAVRIAQTEHGKLTRIVGTVEALGEPATVLTAPFTQRPCVYYLSTVSIAAGRNGWREVAREDRAQDFKLRDESGVAYVVLGGASIDVAQDFHDTSGAFEAPNDTQREFLAKHRLAPTTTILEVNNSYSYRECVLEIGARVTVLGDVRHEPCDDNEGLDAPGQYRASAKKLRVMIVAPAGAKVAVSDSSSLTR
ncbi:MAG: hypothetical protein IPK60_00245 [Sandaracinaceae bacterium]|nr:hypothetical protein [Sandaracinaceae bacterium]